MRLRHNRVNSPYTSIDVLYFLIPTPSPTKQTNKKNPAEYLVGRIIFK